MKVEVSTYVAKYKMLQPALGIFLTYSLIYWGYDSLRIFTLEISFLKQKTCLAIYFPEISSSWMVYRCLNF